MVCTLNEGLRPLLVVTGSVDFDKYSPLSVFEMERFYNAVFNDIIQLDGRISQLIVEAPGEGGLAGAGLAAEIDAVGFIL